MSHFQEFNMIQELAGDRKLDCREEPAVKAHRWEMETKRGDRGGWRAEGRVEAMAIKVTQSL
jgi:hypothetical protein